MASDYLYEIGFDLAAADRQLTDFISKTSNLLTAGLSPAVKTLQGQLNSIGTINVDVKIGQSTKAFKGFMSAVTANEPALTKFSAMITALDGVLVTHNAMLDKQVAAMKAVAVATNETRLAARSLATDLGSINKAGAVAQNSLNKMRAATVANQDALGYLGKVAGNTVFKFLEYQIAMEAFTAGVQEFTSALTEASDVQQEQALQKLYGGYVNVNAALHDAIILAKQWGDTIPDVQQSIGMWSKVTLDQATAEMLTNEALMLHAASGIATNDVTTTTISLMSKLHATASEIPLIYDKITRAAELLALPMKNLGSTTGKQEGIRELLEGLTESFSTLHGEGMDISGVIAEVAAQIQGLGETGKQAGTKLQTMFAGLELGPSGKTFDSLLGPGASKSADAFIQAFQKASPQIEQAVKDALIRVRPQMTETMQSFISMLDVVKKVRDTLNSSGTAGATERAASTMMDTYAGSMARMQTSLQALTIQIGTDLLPVAKQFVDWLGNSLFPNIEKNLPAIESLIQDAGKFLAMMLGWQAIGRIVGGVWTAATALETTMATLAGTSAAVGVAGDSAAVGLGAASTAMWGAVAAAGALLIILGELGGIIAVDMWNDASKASSDATVASSHNPAAVLYTRAQQDQQALLARHAIHDAHPSFHGMSATDGAVTGYSGLSQAEQAQWVHDQNIMNQNAGKRNQSGLLIGQAATYQQLMAQLHKQENANATVPGNAAELPGSTLGGGNKKAQACVVEVQPLLCRPSV